MANRIHPSAVVADGARLGDGNVIGPHAVVGASVILGDDNWIGAGACLGAPPEIRGAAHEAFGEAGGVGVRGVGGGGGASVGVGVGLLVMGHRNVIREHVTIGRGSVSDTKLADDCYVMAGAYIAHDSRVGSRATLSSGVRLAGHVSIGPFATLGLGAVVHQYRTIGAGAMVGMAAVVTRDLPPFALAHGSPARVHGSNVTLLQRLGAGERVFRIVREALAAGRPLTSDQLEEVSPEFTRELRRWRTWCSASGEAATS